jgi:hypothetical protein
MANGGINFLLIVIYHFSLVKAAMNAPHVCKLRKNRLTGINHCTIVLSKSINRRIYDCKLRNEKKFIPSALRIHRSHLLQKQGGALIL